MTTLYRVSFGYILIFVIFYHNNFSCFALDNHEKRNDDTIYRSFIDNKNSFNKIQYDKSTEGNTFYNFIDMEEAYDELHNPSSISNDKISIAANNANTILRDDFDKHKHHGGGGNENSIGSKYFDKAKSIPEGDTNINTIRNYGFDKNSHTTDNNSFRSFVIDYENNCFRKDGEKFQYIAGCLHYFRVHPTDWADRLRKLRYAGLNAVQTYVEWSSHEPEPGVFDFSGMLDLERFILTAQEEDLLVILRVGPYICSERDMGGLPYWLLRLHPDMRLRTSDPNFLRYVDKWLVQGLLWRIVPLLYENGGPVIMLQVENEYGSYYACDYAYMAHLREVFRQGVGNGPLLFTTDNGDTRQLKCGKIPEVYATADFGPSADPVAKFEAQRLFEPRGPLVNSEFYTGWLDHWGKPHQKTNAQEFSTALDRLLSMNASVSMYMFHGGTNFGFSSGANIGTVYESCPTSYDYDAPLSEAGDITDKYVIVRDVIGKYFPLPAVPRPPDSSKAEYGAVMMESIGHLFTLASLLEKMQHPYPLTFEELYVRNGFVLYQTKVTFMTPDPAVLDLGHLHDRAYVFVNAELQGVVTRSKQLLHVTLPLRTTRGDVITMVVESLGRVTVGTHMNDFKGLTSNVTLNSHVLIDWTMVPIPLFDSARLTSALKKLKRHNDILDWFSAANVTARNQQGLGGNSLKEVPHGAMKIYQGVLNIPEESDQPKDTFLRLDGWTKGVVWVNGFCLGRYWPVMGPQQTLYVPHGVLTTGHNSIILSELEGAPHGCWSTIPTARCGCYIKFVDKPDIDSPTPV